MKALRRQFQLLRMAGLDSAGRIAALDKADGLLTEVQGCGLRVPSALETQWQDYLDSQQQQVHKGMPDRDLRLTRVRGLRVEACGFADDGADRADDLLRWLARERIQLDAEQQQLLEAAAEALDPDEQQLQALQQLRDQLLDRLLPDYRPQKFAAA